MNNPKLIVVLAELLQDSSCPQSEYQLLQQLEQHSEIAHIQASCAQQPQLLLFRKHFTLMNALYRLQQNLWHEQRRLLEISALEIILREPQQSQSSGDLAFFNSKNLRDYYLNWDNYLNTDEFDVNNLLSDFWTAFSGMDKRPTALQLFELELSAKPREIERRYRQLASRHHPDKGGSSEKFIQIREAWEILKR